MSEYNVYGELFDKRPELIIHNRLKNSGTMMQVLEIAKDMNFKVSYSQGPFRQDMQINWHEDEGRRPETHSVHSGLRYLQRMKDLQDYQEK